jgi:hypothetical protein
MAQTSPERPEPAPGACDLRVHPIARQYAASIE